MVFGEVGVGLDERFVVLKGGFELVVEVLLAGLGLFQCPCGAAGFSCRSAILTKSMDLSPEYSR